MPKYIDKVKLIQKINQEYWNRLAWISKEGAERIIIELETEDVAPVVHASWVGAYYDGYADGYPVYEEYECSNCRYSIETDEKPTYAYCPCCGAKMDLCLLSMLRGKDGREL